jgi:hypothetical protein
MIVHEKHLAFGQHKKYLISEECSAQSKEKECGKFGDEKLCVYPAGGDV